MKTDAPARTYRTPEVCRMLGISFRQLDYWCREGVIDQPPPGYGKVREFTAEDVWRLRVVAMLRPFGWSVADTRMLLDGVIPVDRLQQQANKLMWIASVLDR